LELIVQLEESILGVVPKQSQWHSQNEAMVLPKTNLLSFFWCFISI